MYGTVKENVSASDLSVTGLPNGLNLSAVKVPDNKIKITLNGTAVGAVSITTKVNIVVNSSAVEEDGAIDSPGIDFNLTPTSFQLSTNAFDASIDMEAGNKTINTANNNWAINGINGTLKENMSAGDLNVTGLPDGLILLAAKGPDNKIIITLTGTAVGAVLAITNVNIVVKVSAVEEDGATNSTGVSMQLNPFLEVAANYTIISGMAIALDLSNLTATATIKEITPHEGKEFIAFELVDNTTQQSVGILSHDLIMGAAQCLE